MTASAKLVELNPQPIFEELEAVISAYECGSTITVCFSPPRLAKDNNNPAPTFINFGYVLAFHGQYVLLNLYGKK